MANKLDLRPNITTQEWEQSLPEERFQSQTLRPVLKLQNELVLALFQACLQQSKNNFGSLSKEDQRLFITRSLQNKVLRNQYIGLVIGMFTTSEFEEYASATRVYNKRMMGLVAERLSSQL